MRMCKKIAMMMVCIFMVTTLSGCDLGVNEETLFGEAGVALLARIELNKEQFSRLQKAGLLNPDVTAGIQKSIDEAEKLASNLKNEKNLKVIAEATVAYYADTNFATKRHGRVTSGETMTDEEYTSVKFFTGEMGNKEKNAKEDRLGLAKSNFSPADSDGWRVRKEHTTDTNSKVVPIEIIKKDHLEKFNSVLNYEVYVLKTKEEILSGMQNIEKSDASKMISINAVVQAVAQATNNGTASNTKDIDDLAMMNLLFKPAIKPETLGTTQEETIKLFDWANNPEGAPMDKSKQYNSTSERENSENKPGYNLVIEQTVYPDYEEADKGKKDLLAVSHPILEIQLQEFNTDVIDKLCNANSYTGQKYLVVQNEGNTGGRVYLMEYDVQVLSEIFKVNNNAFDTTFEKGDLKLNLLSNSIMTANGVTISQSGSSYIDIGGPLNSSSLLAEGNSSFFLMEEGDIELPTGETVKGGGIGLRDYLEMTYMPGIVPGETFIAAGRKIRLLNLKGDIDNPIAAFYDEEQNPVAGLDPIYAWEIGDFMAAAGSPAQLNKLADRLETVDIKKPGKGTPNVGKSNSGEHMTKKDENEETAGKGTASRPDVDNRTYKKAQENDDTGGNGNESEVSQENRLLHEENIIPLSTGTSKKLYGNGSNPLQNTISLQSATTQDYIQNLTAPIGLNDSFNIMPLSVNGGLGTDNSENDESADESKDEGSLEVFNENVLGGLPLYVTDSVNPTIRFPSTMVGNVDNSGVLEKERIIFYGIFLAKPPFETNFYAGWIDNGDATTKSLNWWNNWLHSNNFNYKINAGAIENYFTGNYSYEMGQDGYVVLDLNTIAKIQHGYEIEDSAGRVTWIRTLFGIIGVILVFMSLVLLAAWAFDTNLDLGINVLQKISLGNWIAVKDEKEMPQFDDEEYSYVGLGKIIIICAIIAVIGIALLSVDIVAIVIKLMEIFGGFAEAIENIFLK